MTFCKRCGAVVLAGLVAVPAEGARLHPERWYQDGWCGEAGGVTEFRLPCRARVDCLTDTHAIEFDFADKWAEAVGQALYYGEATGREAGIVLILEQPDRDMRYVHRLHRALKRDCLRVHVWLVGPDGEPVPHPEKKVSSPLKPPP